MVDQRTDARAVAQHGLITRTQAIALGMSRSAILHRRKRGLWHLVTPGVYRLAGAPPSELQRAMAAVLAAGEGAALSHRSAAALHRLPGYSIEPIVVSVVRNGRRRLPNVRIKQSLALPDHHLTVIDGIPCTTLARTLFDLCGDRRTWRGAERALDTALARKLVTMAQLWRVLIDLAEHGRAGTVRFRTLLEERRGEYVAPESELEARFAALVRTHGLIEPERQVDLGDDDGWIGRVDFLFRASRLVVELDGGSFHDGLVDRRTDQERDARLGAAGWRVLRFRWTDLHQRPLAVIASIRCAFDTSQRVDSAPK